MARVDRRDSQKKGGKTGWMERSRVSVIAKTRPIAWKEAVRAALDGHDPGAVTCGRPITDNKRPALHHAEIVCRAIRISGLKGNTATWYGGKQPPCRRQ